MFMLYNRANNCPVEPVLMADNNCFLADKLKTNKYAPSFLVDSTQHVAYHNCLQEPHTNAVILQSLFKECYAPKRMTLYHTFDSWQDIGQFSMGKYCTTLPFQHSLPNVTQKCANGSVIVCIDVQANTPGIITIGDISLINNTNVFVPSSRHCMDNVYVVMGALSSEQSRASVVQQRDNAKRPPPYPPNPDITLNPPRPSAPPAPNDEHALNNTSPQEHAKTLNAPQRDTNGVKQQPPPLPTPARPAVSNERTSPQTHAKQPPPLPTPARPAVSNGRTSPQEHAKTSNAPQHDTEVNNDNSKPSELSKTNNADPPPKYTKAKKTLQLLTPDEETIIRQIKHCWVKIPMLIKERILQVENAHLLPQPK